MKLQDVQQFFLSSEQCDSVRKGIGWAIHFFYSGNYDKAKDAFEQTGELLKKINKNFQNLAKQYKDLSQYENFSSVGNELLKKIVLHNEIVDLHIKMSQIQSGSVSMSHFQPKTMMMSNTTNPVASNIIATPSFNNILTVNGRKNPTFPQQNDNNPQIMNTAMSPRNANAEKIELSSKKGPQTPPPTMQNPNTSQKEAEIAPTHQMQATSSEEKPSADMFSYFQQRLKNLGLPTPPKLEIPQTLDKKPEPIETTPKFFEIEENFDSSKINFDEEIEDETQFLHSGDSKSRIIEIDTSITEIQKLQKIKEEQEKLIPQISKKQTETLQIEQSPNSLTKIENQSALRPNIDHSPTRMNSNSNLLITFQKQQLNAPPKKVITPPPPKKVVLPSSAGIFFENPKLIFFTLKRLISDLDTQNYSLFFEKLEEIVFQAEKTKSEISKKANPAKFPEKPFTIEGIEGRTYETFLEKTLDIEFAQLEQKLNIDDQNQEKFENNFKFSSNFTNYGARFCEFFEIKKILHDFLVLSCLIKKFSSELTFLILLNSSLHQIYSTLCPKNENPSEEKKFEPNSILYDEECRKIYEKLQTLMSANMSNILNNVFSNFDPNTYNKLSNSPKTGQIPKFQFHEHAICNFFESLYYWLYIQDLISNTKTNFSFPDFLKDLVFNFTNVLYASKVKKIEQERAAFLSSKNKKNLNNYQLLQTSPSADNINNSGFQNLSPNSIESHAANNRKNKIVVGFSNEKDDHEEIQKQAFTGKINRLCLVGDYIYVASNHLSNHFTCAFNELLTKFCAKFPKFANYSSSTSVYSPSVSPVSLFGSSKSKSQFLNSVFNEKETLNPNIFGEWVIESFCNNWTNDLHVFLNEAHDHQQIAEKENELYALDLSFFAKIYPKVVYILKEFKRKLENPSFSSASPSLTTNLKLNTYFASKGDFISLFQKAHFIGRRFVCYHTHFFLTMYLKSMLERENIGKRTKVFPVGNSSNSTTISKSESSISLSSTSSSDSNHETTTGRACVKTIFSPFKVFLEMDLITLRLKEICDNPEIEDNVGLLCLMFLRQLLKDGPSKNGNSKEKDGSFAGNQIFTSNSDPNSTNSSISLTTTSTSGKFFNNLLTQAVVSSFNSMIIVPSMESMGLAGNSKKKRREKRILEFFLQENSISVEKLLFQALNSKQNLTYSSVLERIRNACFYFNNINACMTEFKEIMKYFFKDSKKYEFFEKYLKKENIKDKIESNLQISSSKSNKNVKKLPKEQKNGKEKSKNKPENLENLEKLSETSENKPDGPENDGINEESCSEEVKESESESEEEGNDYLDDFEIGDDESEDQEKEFDRFFSENEREDIYELKKRVISLLIPASKPKSKKFGSRRLNQELGSLRQTKMNSEKQQCFDIATFENVFATIFENITKNLCIFSSIVPEMQETGMTELFCSEPTEFQEKFKAYLYFFDGIFEKIAECISQDLIDDLMKGIYLQFIRVCSSFLKTHQNNRFSHKNFQKFFKTLFPKLKSANISIQTDQKIKTVFKGMNALFYADGDGLSPNFLLNYSKKIADILQIYRFTTEELIEQFQNKKNEILKIIQKTSENHSSYPFFFQISPENDPNFVKFLEGSSNSNVNSISPDLYFFVLSCRKDRVARSFVREEKKNRKNLKKK